MPTLLRPALVRDALSRLSGWTGDTAGISRALSLSPSEYADFAERLKVCSDAMKHQADVRRLGNHTLVRLSSPDEGGITDCDIALAARIDYIVRVVAGRHAASAGSPTGSHW